MEISGIVIHDESRVPEIRPVELAGFLGDALRVRASVGGIAMPDISGCRIWDTKRPFSRQPPMPEDAGDVQLYDGYRMQEVLGGAIREAGRTLHVVITDRLICTFDEQDYRYHARALVASNPAIISTSGMVEAPARPREYYVDSLSGPREQVMERYRGRFLEHGDSRAGRVAKGYAMQAAFYFGTGEAFCPDADCMLYNAHWQEELIHSQVESQSLCERHRRVLESLQSRTD